MYIDTLSFENFRNLKKDKIVLSHGLNVFCGDNAQGKTNLIESAYMCALGKSPRTDKDKDLVCFGKEDAFVACGFLRNFGQCHVEIQLSTHGKKVLFNGNLLEKTSSLLGNLCVVFFSPQAIKIVSESPLERRKFLDVDLCQLDKRYLFALNTFSKALTQRNNLLKAQMDDGEKQKQMEVWDCQLAQSGATLAFKRKEFCAQLKKYAEDAQKKISCGKETLKLHYVSQIKGDTTEEYQNDYLAFLKENYQSDLQRGWTQGGCQRDDVALYCNGNDVKKFGSRGQQRTAALALKIAETEIFRERIGEYPVLLLDDVLSELDDSRQRALADFSRNMQIIVTCCSDEHAVLGNDAKFFRVENGTVVSD